MRHQLHSKTVKCVGCLAGPIPSDRKVGEVVRTWRTAWIVTIVRRESRMWKPIIDPAVRSRSELGIAVASEIMCAGNAPAINSTPTPKWVDNEGFSMFYVYVYVCVA